MKHFQRYFLSVVLTVVLSMLFIRCNAQEFPQIDRTKMTKTHEINFAYSDKRGIEASEGTIYLVEQNLKVLTAYRNGIVKWKADIIAKCGELRVGKPEIRFIRLNEDHIFVVFGKHSYADVFISNGKVMCTGSD